MSTTVPKLRFPEFTDDWQTKKLSDMGEIVTGKTPPTSQAELWDGDIPFITPSDIAEDSKYQLQTERQVTKTVNLKLLPPGTICYTCIASIGKMSICTSHSITNQQINSVVPYEANSNEFIYYAILQLSPKIKASQANTTLPIINKTDFSNFAVYVPQKDEQLKVGAFLAKFDEHRHVIRKNIDSLNRYKQSVMQKIFTQELRFKNKDGKHFPDWNQKDFDTVLDSVSTKLFQIQSSEYKEQGDYPVVDQGQKKVIGYSDQTDKVFKNGPVIIFGDHTTFLKYVDFDFVVGADGTKILKQKAGDNLRYLFYYLQYNQLKPEGYKRHFSILRKLKFSLPDIAEQQKIADFLTSIDEKIELQEKRLEQTNPFKQYLLQRMFV